MTVLTSYTMHCSIKQACFGDKILYCISSKLLNVIYKKQVIEKYNKLSRINMPGIRPQGALVGTVKFLVRSKILH